jgi:hypothetical protein
MQRFLLGNDFGQFSTNAAFFAKAVAQFKQKLKEVQ